jgi:hypothetical protein
VDAAAALLDLSVGHGDDLDSVPFEPLDRPSAGAWDRWACL